MSIRKEGRVLSGDNLNELHSALSALHAVHDAACADPDCPIVGGTSGSKRVMRRAAMVAGLTKMARDKAQRVPASVKTATAAPVRSVNPAPGELGAGVERSIQAALRRAGWT